MIPVIKDSFSCGRCGGCCTRIKSAFSAARGKEQKIVFTLVDEKDAGLPLWEWEAERIRKIAEERKLQAKIEELQFFYDKKSETSVIISYHLNYGSCIFYEPGKCTIYENRPVVCSMFPVTKSSVFGFAFGRTNVILEKTLCGSDHGAETIRGEMTPKQYVEKMRAYYGSSFLAAVQNDVVNYFVVKKIKQMADEKIIDPVMAPRSLALNRYKNSKKASFLDFLAERGEDRASIIEGLSSGRQAENMISQILGE